MSKRNGLGLVSEEDEVSKVLLEFVKLVWKKIVRPLMRRFYTAIVRIEADYVGKELRVNGPSKVNSHTRLGDNVNFNGLQVHGGGLNWR